MPVPLALLAPLIPVLASYIPDIGRLIAGTSGEQVGQVVQRVAGSLDPAAVAVAMADDQKAGEILQRVEEIRARVEIAREEEATKRLQAALHDVAGARAASVELAKAGSRIAWAPALMSILIVAGFFGCVALVMLVEKSWDERTTTIINTLLGALTISFGQVCNYWLGSSRGSAAKDERVDAAMSIMHRRTAPAQAEPSSRLFPRSSPDV